MPSAEQVVATLRLEELDAAAAARSSALELAAAPESPPVHGTARDCRALPDTASTAGDRVVRDPVRHWR
jgi:hypothetical protein